MTKEKGIMEKIERELMNKVKVGWINGCGRKVGVSDFYCGYYGLKTLCEKCEFKLEGYEQAEKDILKLIPSSWLDPIFERYLLRQRYSPQDIEDILNLIRNRIKLSLKEGNKK